MAREHYTITKENLTGEFPLCSYVQSYFKSAGFKVGDRWNAVDYMEWINEKHDYFRAKYNIADHCEYNENQQKAFKEYINS